MLPATAASEETRLLRVLKAPPCRNQDGGRLGSTEADLHSGSRRDDLELGRPAVYSATDLHWSRGSASGGEGVTGALQ
jgi:hypothetical protein